MPPVRSPLWPLALALGLLGCPAAPAPTPAASAPARRAATPPPIATPTPSAGPDLSAIRRMRRLAPWIRHEAGQTYFTFLFYDEKNETIFFAIQPPLAVRYTFTRLDGGALASGTATMAADALKFDLPLPEPLPQAVHAVYHVALPDARTLKGELDVPVETGPGP